MHVYCMQAVTGLQLPLTDLDELGRLINGKSRADAFTKTPKLLNKCWTVIVTGQGLSTCAASDELDPGLHFELMCRC